MLLENWNFAFLEQQFFVLWNESFICGGQYKSVIIGWKWVCASRFVNGRLRVDRWGLMGLCLVWRSAPDLALSLCPFSLSLALLSLLAKNAPLFRGAGVYWTILNNARKTFINFDGCFLFGVRSHSLLLYAQVGTCKLGPTYILHCAEREKQESGPVFIKKCPSKFLTFSAPCLCLCT
jgi:hypothetical protein